MLNISLNNCWDKAPPEKCQRNAPPLIRKCMTVATTKSPNKNSRKRNFHLNCLDERRNLHQHQFSFRNFTLNKLSRGTATHFYRPDTWLSSLQPESNFVSLPRDAPLLQQEGSKLISREKEQKRRAGHKFRRYVSWSRGRQEEGKERKDRVVHKFCVRRSIFTRCKRR